MKSKTIYITKEQDEYRKSVLKKRSQKTMAVLQIPKPVTTREVYMKNCLYWINEYTEGSTDKKEMVRNAISHLKRYCDEILNELK